MFAIESRWKLEPNENLLVLKIIGKAKMSNKSFLDNQVKRQMIFKMATLVSEAEKYNGKVLDTVPTFENEPKTFTVCSSIAFDTAVNFDAFINACPKILNQG